MVQRDLVDGTSDEALEAGASTITLAHARALVQQFAEVTTSKDVGAFISGFTDDCVVHYGQFPEIRGKAALRDFMTKMFPPRLKDFTCRKTLRSLSGNVIGVTWISEWTDAQSGNKRKKGRGFEFWIMRGDRIARWDAAFNVWNDD